MTETFPDIPPSYGTAGETTFTVKVAKFGDGYKQRTTDGLNSKVDSWSLVWDNIEQADVDTIKAFLDARNGCESFYWTAVGESTPKKWTCSQYGRRPTGGTILTYTAKFVQEFDL